MSGREFVTEGWCASRRVSPVALQCRSGPVLTCAPEGIRTPNLLAYFSPVAMSVSIRRSMR